MVIYPLMLEANRLFYVQIIEILLEGYLTFSRSSPKKASLYIITFSSANSGPNTALFKFSVCLLMASKVSHDS